jgi:CheY-like chemotaxis protein/signal recognition particle receptor subunit beta
MTNPLVLVADGDPKNLQILKENLEASGFVVITVSTGNKAWEEIQQTPPNLVLTEINLPGLTGYQLLERLQADPNTKSIPLIFLTNQREIQHRVRGFEMGAKDYLVKPLHVKEVIAHIRMVLRRLERRKTEQLETYMKFSGRLDQLNLADLIESFGVERKTGVLTLSNGRRTGQVCFRDGAVVNASLGNMKQEPAIYQMLPWSGGYFNMVFKEIDAADEISISNLGLLLHGIKRMEIREKLIDQLSSPKTSFTITPTFKMLVTKKRVNGEIANFVKLFDGKREVEQIIDDSGLDDLVVLKRIVRLYQQGFIKPTIPPKKKPVLSKKVEHDEEKIEFVSRPIPLKTTPSMDDFIEEKISDDEDYDIKPQEVPKDLEKEIKPIFERIEQEKKQLLIPDEKEKPDEVYPVPEEEGQELPEKVLDAETDLTSAIELEDEELTASAEETFIDEELIQKPIGIQREDILKPTEIEDRSELIFKPKEEPKEEPEEEVEFEAIRAGRDIEEKRLETPPISERPKPVEPPKPEKKEPIRSEPAPVKNNVIVISVDDDCKDELMDILTNDNFASKRIQELEDLQLDFGKIKLEGFASYNIVAVSVDKPFNVFLESIRQRICGFIFALDYSRQETWEYTSYLIHSILYKFHFPYVVAVMNFLDQNSVSMDVIRYQLNVGESIPLIAWDAVDRTSIRKLMNLVTNSNFNEKNRKTADMLSSFVEKVTM